MPGAVFLEGGRINLRTYEKEDMEFIRDNYNSKNVRKYMFMREPVNLGELEDGFEEIKEDEHIRLVISSEEEPVGMIFTTELSQDDGKAEIGIWLKEESQGQGIGKEASRIFIDYLFDQLRVHKAAV